MTIITQPAPVAALRIIAMSQTIKVEIITELNEVHLVFSATAKKKEQNKTK
jgi:hypothetical protein